MRISGKKGVVIRFQVCIFDILNTANPFEKPSMFML